MRSILAAAAVLLSSGAAFAAPVSNAGFMLDLTGSVNVPTLTLTNTSSGAVTLDGFTFTIGNTAYNFDEVSALSSPANMAIVIGSTAQSGTRTDLVEFNFTNLSPTTAYSWELDVDIDSSNTSEDYRGVFFNNGAAPNSVATATFSNGQVLSVTLPDDTLESSYSYRVSADVPAPAALPLLAAALGGLGLLRRRR